MGTIETENEILRYQVKALKAELRALKKGRRPFETMDEAASAVNEKGSFVREKKTKQLWNVCYIGEDFIGFDCWRFTFAEAFEKFEFRDGSAFGK